MADRGTLFLDEIGDMSPTCQAKVLRALDTHEITPLGGLGKVPLDIRVIAATNQPLLPLIEEHRFRKDLSSTGSTSSISNCHPCEIARKIPLLLQHYLRHFNHCLSEHVEGVTPDAIAALMRYDWPGNVRELRNLIELLFVDPQEIIGFDQLPERFRHIADDDGTTEKTPNSPRSSARRTGTRAAPRASSNGRA